MIIHGNVVDRNANNGIDADSGVIEGNSVRLNLIGIFVFRGSITANLVEENSAHGIASTAIGGGALIKDNAIRENATCGVAILETAPSGFASNVMTGNNGSSANRQVKNGIDLGGNICGDHACGTGPINNCP